MIWQTLQDTAQPRARYIAKVLPVSGLVCIHFCNNVLAGGLLFVISLYFLK